MRTLRRLVLLLLVLNGLLFLSNIYVLGDTRAAVAMHDDLAPDVSATMANVKVIVTFVTGGLYLLAALGAAGRWRRLAACGIVAFGLFDGLYLYELAAWSHSYPRVWIDFAVFGGLALVFGVFSWRWARHRPAPQAAARDRQPA